jgi:hypothetical protein
LTSDLSGYVPYTGATANVNLGTFDLRANVLTGTIGSFSSNSSSYTVAINQTSGSGIALNIQKSGNGEGLYINKASGSGNAATIIGTLNATTLVKSGGTSSQFLKADGSVDSNSYVTIDTTQTITGVKTFGSSVTINTAGQSILSIVSSAGNSSDITSSIAGVLKSTISTSATEFKLISAIDNILKFQSSTNFRASLIFSNTADYSYTYPNASGTIALLSGTQTFTGATTFSSSITVSGISVGTAGNGSNIKLGDTNFGAITTGSNNIAIGSSALSSITTSNANIGIGNSALASVVDGAFNIALGFGVGASITSGSNNTLFGYGAGQSITTGNYNTILGAYAGTAGMSNNIVLADGQGNIRYQWNGTNNVFGNPISGTSATFSSNVQLTGDGYVYGNATAGSGTIRAGIRFNSTDQELKFFTSDFGRLTIASTGAATFSSSVTAGGLFTAQGGVSAAPSTSGTTINGSAVIKPSDGSNAIIMGAYGTSPFGNWIQSQSTSALGTTFPLILQPNGGNVGIGTSSPSTKLQVSAANGVIANFVGSSGNYGQIYSDANAAVFGASTSTSLGINYLYINPTLNFQAFITNGNERMQITSGGSVLIGTTSVNWVGSGFTLSADSGTNKWLCGPYTGAGNQFYITAAAGSGVYLASTSASSWSALSDERFKENLIPIENAISKLSKLRPFIGNYIEDDKKTKHPFLIAQDVLQVIPEAVDVSNPEKYGLSYTDLIPVLVKAIQELEARIKQLENK